MAALYFTTFSQANINSVIALGNLLFPFFPSFPFVSFLSLIHDIKISVYDLCGLCLSLHPFYILEIVNEAFSCLVFYQ